MHFVVEHQLHTFQIARAQEQRMREGLAVLDDQGRARHIQLVQRRPVELSLAFGQLQRIHHGQLAVRQL